jgi:hypothetical protein
MANIKQMMEDRGITSMAVNRSSSRAPANYSESVYSDAHLKRKPDRNDEEQALYEALVEGEVEKILEANQGQAAFMKDVVRGLAVSVLERSRATEARKQMKQQEESLF